MSLRLPTAGRRLHADVCVVGGGPAGSSVAQRLASLGHDVCLVERDGAARPQVAASLPPSILPLLEVIGIRAQVENAGFLRPEGTIVWWSEPAPTVRPRPGPAGFHVERSVFDRLLLNNAAATGVRLLEPAQAIRPLRLNGGGWKIPVRHEAGCTEVISRFVIDASGRRSLLGGAWTRVSAPLVALSAELRGVDPREIEGRVEAGEAEWFWYAPLGDGRAVASVFTDPKRLAGPAHGGIASTYQQLLGRFRLLGGRQRGVVTGTVTACDASHRSTQEPAGTAFVKVGDACFTLDPLSSQGIQSAVASALQAAAVVNTMARHPERSQQAIAFYRERQAEKVRRYAAKTALFYRERAAVRGQPFWTQRATCEEEDRAPPLEDETLHPQCRIQLSPSAVIEPTPVIEDDLVVCAPAVRQEDLDRPVAFLGDFPVVPLLRQIRSGQSAESVVRDWSERLPAEVGWSILRWLWHRRIVVRAVTNGGEHSRGIAPTAERVLNRR